MIIVTVEANGYSTRGPLFDAFVKDRTIGPALSDALARHRTIGRCAAAATRQSALSLSLRRAAYQVLALVIPSRARSLLGAILTDNGAFQQASFLRPQDFYEAIHGKLFEILASLQTRQTRTHP
jgi:hypothetical protein